MKNRNRGILTGVVAGLLVICLAGTCMAITENKHALLEFMNIRVTLDGKDVTPKDVEGNTVEPFAINGTTYLPIRGISHIAGLGVGWDQATHTVTLTSPPPVEVTPPEPTAPEVQYNKGSLRGSAVEIKGWTIGKDRTGGQALIVEFNWTNNSGQAASADTMIQTAAFQNGALLKQAELPTTTNYTGKTMDAQVKAGESLDVYLAYALPDKAARVEFELSDPVSSVNADKQTVYATFSLNS